MLFYRTKNKKICQMIWIFVICKKFVKYRKEVSNIARKKGLDTAKAASTKVVRKIVEEQVNS